MTQLATSIQDTLIFCWECLFIPTLICKPNHLTYWRIEHVTRKDDCLFIINFDLMLVCHKALLQILDRS